MSRHCYVIGLDTNVLVSYIMYDDAKQAAFADKMFKGLTLSYLSSNGCLSCASKKSTLQPSLRR